MLKGFAKKVGSEVAQDVLAEKAKEQNEKNSKGSQIFYYFQLKTTDVKLSQATQQALAGGKDPLNDRAVQQAYENCFFL